MTQNKNILPRRKEFTRILLFCDTDDTRQPNLCPNPQNRMRVFIFPPCPNLFKHNIWYYAVYLAYLHKQSKNKLQGSNTLQKRLCTKYITYLRNIATSMCVGSYCYSDAVCNRTKTLASFKEMHRLHCAEAYVTNCIAISFSHEIIGRNTAWYRVHRWEHYNRIGFWNMAKVNVSVVKL